MNFLELCQDLVQEAGITGTIASVSSQTGEMKRVVSWIKKAYRTIINDHPTWKFLRTEFSFDTLIGTGDYSATALSLTEFGEWKLDSFRAYTKTIGLTDEQFVRPARDYDAFRDRYLFGAMRSQQSRPQLVAEKPDQALRLWPLPDVVYTVVGEYYKFPAPLAANADLPVFPAKFHEAIVWRALMFYGEYEQDATVFASAQTEFARVLTQMTLLYLPSIETSGPMA